MHLAAFSGRNAAYHFGSIGYGLLGMEGALRAGKPLTDHFGVFFYENCHVLPLDRRYNFFGAVFKIIGCDHIQS